MSQENKTPAQQLNSKGELNQKQKDIDPRKINYYDVFKKDSDTEPEKIDFDSKICDICWKDLPLNMFLRSAMEADGHRKTCRDCTKKQKAVKALQEISEYVDLDTPFKKEELSRKINIDSALFEYYIDILLELELIKAVKGSNLYILPKTKQLNEYGVSFNSAKILEKDNFRNNRKGDLNLKNGINKETKICDTCNKELELSRFLRTHFEPDGHRKTCRECTKKQNAARALKNLLKYIEIDEKFTSEQLKGKVKSSFGSYERYIWSLEGIGLVKYDENSKTYNLKNTEQLIDFCSEFSIEIPEQKNELSNELSSNHDNKPDLSSLKENKGSEKSLPEKKDSILETKKCDDCKKDLELKKFSKSPAEPDGYDKLCLDCKKESQAANGLKKILKYIDIDVPFEKQIIEEKTNIYPTLLENYLNILQDLDLISYDKKSNHYVIESGPKFIEFCQKNDISLPEDPSKVIEKNKTCDTCGKELLLSQFPLSFVEADGHQKNCNTCRKKIQAAEGLQKLIKIIEIGVPFEKPALLENYLNILVELDLIKYNAKNKEYTLKKSENLLEFCEKFNILLIDEIKNKKCVSCGKKLPVSNFLKKSSETDGYDKTCRECTKKEDAVSGIKKLIKLVDFNIPFKKEDLTKKIDTKPSLFYYYLDTLLEMDLIKYNPENNEYTLKKSENLLKFCKKFNIPLIEKIKNKKCEICGKHIDSSIFRISTPLGPKRACSECSNKENAVLGMKKLIKIVDFNTPFKKEDLIKKIDINPSLFYYYLDILLELNLINYNGSSKEYILEKTDELEQFFKENKIVLPEPSIEKPKVALTSENDSNVSLEKEKIIKPENNSKTPSENHKICDICGKELDLSLFLRSRTEPDGYRKTCRSCSKKQNAARGLKKIIEYIDMDTEFTKEYLKKNFKEQFELFENYIFVLQELDLIQYDENKKTFKIENNANLQDFCSEFDISLGEVENRLSGHKKCNFCGKELPVSQFMKSNREPDGYRKICKSCSKKRTAIQGLKELLKYVKIDQEFDWNYLKNNVKGSFSLFENYIWALQELDLIKYDDKLKKFTIEPTEAFNKFCEENDINPDQIKSIDSGAYDLEHKELNEKSKEIVDSLKTADLSNPEVVLRIKSEILNCGLEAVEPLISLLDDPNPDVRNNSARILGDLKDKRAILPLLKLKNDDDPEVIRAAAYALSKLGDENNFRKFLNLLGSKKYKARGIILDKDSKTKICESCEEELPFEEFYKSKAEKDGLSRKCKDCVKKDQAYNGLKELRKYVSFNSPFNKKTLLNKIEKKGTLTKSTFSAYLNAAVNEGYVEKIDEETYVLNKTDALYEFLSQYESIEPFELEESEEKEFNNSTPSTEIKLKICESCGEELPLEEFYKSKAEKDGLSRKCKLCLKKVSAYKGIKELRRLVQFNTAFIKKSKVDQFEEKNDKISRSTFLGYLKAAEDLGYLEKMGENSYILHEKESLDFIEKYEDNLKFELYSSETLKSETSVKTPQIPENILKTMFSQWIFKYQEIQFIPHSENGLKFFKGLLETLEEKEILELIDFDNIEKEKGLLENRLSSNELKEEEIDKISQFLKDILTYLNHRFGDEYWIDAPEKPPIKTYSGNYITELNLWNHQIEAIHNWTENGSRGLLEMATGTGKTLTALGCLKEKIIRENKLLVVIACPFNHLVSQWERELEKIGIFSHKMTADSTNPKWKKELKNALIDIKIGTYNYIIVLTTHKTMSSPKFIDLINDASNKDNETLLIVDEVHGIGAPEMRKGLISRYDYRLGLSATPSRWMDEDGTGEIMDFFQGTVFKFDLQKAINTINPSTGESFLCPYEYKPYLVDLNYEEISSYNELSKKIAQAYSKGNSLPELISNRHEIVDNASNKYGSLKNILDNIPNIQHTLVYCSPRQIESVQKILNEKAIIQHKFTMKEGVHKRKEYGGISQREYLLKNFDKGVYQALVAIKCLDEGVDIPSAKIAVMMSSTRNPIQYVQRRGRILRRDPGKEKAIIYDLIVIPQPDLEDYEYKKVERKLIQKEIDRYREFASTAINHEDCLNVITELEKKLGVDE
ncbi:MAG: DEAD/DEAH box helicase family protein [Methanobacteriaceae archaeon]|nr:DEAD/DEAH box helicase family protein [Methanobacteriaceae archaeon]